jgi:polysaccharide biosynthesis transport protein
MADVRPVVHSVDQPFDWSDFTRAISCRRGTVFWTAAIVVALTSLIVMRLPSLFTSSAVVMLDQQKNNVADSSSVLSTLPNDAASVQNQIQILTSRDLAGKVVDRLGLDRDAEFNPSLAGPGLKGALLASLGFAPPPAANGRDAAIDALRKKVDASALGLSTSISVGFTAKDPVKAAKIANAVVDTYVAGQIETKSMATKKAAAWMNARIDQLSRQLEEEEIAVENYKNEHNLVDSGQAASLIEQQMATIGTQMVTAQSDLAEKQAVYERAEALMRSGRPADLTQVVSSELMVKLRTQEADLVKEEADYATRYGANHPKMVAVKTQKRDLENKIALEASRITGAMASDVAVARAHLGSLQTSMKRTGKQSNGDNLARVTLNALTAKAASTRQMYESFVSKLRGIQDQDAIQSSESRIISHAAPSAQLSSPHRALFIAASLPFGLLLGILLALIGERFATAKSRRPAGALPPSPPPSFTPPVYAPTVPVESAMPPVWAELPAVGTVHAADAVLDAPFSPYAAAISTLAQKLAAGSRVVALTSFEPDFGRSVTALGLARASTRHGLSCVLIETGMPSLLPQLGLNGSPAGFAEVLSGTVGLTNAMVKDPRSAVYLMPAGRPVDLRLPLARNRLLELLSYFRKTGVFTLIDAGPGCLDTGLLQPPFCDAAALVVRTGGAPPRLNGALSGISGLIVTR